MEYTIIAEELVKIEFSKNSYGSLEKTIGNLKITFIETPFYHIIMYSRKSENGGTLFTPSDIKLPKICDTNDVLFVINSLVQGVSEDKIIMDIINKLNPDDATDKQEVKSKVKSNEIKFEIKETTGVLSESSKGMEKRIKSNKLE